MSCVLPFINIEARTDGTMSVCCIMQDHAKKEDGSDYNLANGDTITDVMNSQWLKDKQEAFNKGKQIKACNNCWKEEEAGITSKRERENIYWQHTPHDKLVALDLKLGNICNSKCRICSSFASSQWAAEEARMDPLNKEKYTTFNKLGQWPQTNDKFWLDVDSYLDTVKKLEFYGGEPLLIAKHFEILEKCIEKDVAKFITLSYNTNGSIYPTKHVELWKHFKHVELFFSLDDTYERFNYIRHPGNFTEVIENLIKFKNLSLDKNNGNYTLGIFQTISVFNILDLDELTKYAHDHLGIPIHYNMVFTPNHISPKVLPKAVKQFISNKYKYHPEYIQRILNFMNGEDYKSRYWRRFIQITKFSDKYRKESFPETFPQLYQLIKEDWDDGEV